MAIRSLVGHEWKERGVNQRIRNGRRYAISVSKRDHNVTNALLGCSFRDHEVGGSNPLAPTNQFKHLRLPTLTAVFILWPICGSPRLRRTRKGDLPLSPRPQSHMVSSACDQFAHQRDGHALPCKSSQAAAFCSLPTCWKRNRIMRLVY